LLGDVVAPTMTITLPADKGVVVQSGIKGTSVFNRCLFTPLSFVRARRPPIGMVEERYFLPFDANGKHVGKKS